jgi:hypothetical protein
MINKENKIVGVGIVEPVAVGGTGGNSAPRGEQKLRGNQFYHAPGAPLTVSDTTLPNAVIRIGEIEALLQKLGLLK